MPMRRKNKSVRVVQRTDTEPWFRKNVKRVRMRNKMRTATRRAQRG